MGLPIDDVKRIKEEFEQEYFFAEPFAVHVNLCGVSKVGIKDENAPADKKDDFCISVGLRNQLPPDLALPEEYQGVKVFVEVVGEIVIHSY